MPHPIDAHHARRLAVLAAWTNPKPGTLQLDRFRICYLAEQFVLFEGDNRIAIKDSLQDAKDLATDRICDLLELGLIDPQVVQKPTNTKE